MTLEEMLTLDYDEHKFRKIKPENVMGYCNTCIMATKRRWYITENHDLIDLIESIGNGLYIFDSDDNPVHVMQWNEFFIVGLNKPSALRIDDRDEYMESLGWELIPPKYYSQEVGRT